MATNLLGGVGYRDRRQRLNMFSAQSTAIEYKRTRPTGDRRRILHPGTTTDTRGYPFRRNALQSSSFVARIAATVDGSRLNY